MGRVGKSLLVAWIALSSALIGLGGHQLTVLQHRADEHIVRKACAAVRDSNADLDDFLSKRITDPQGKAFVKGLKDDHLSTYKRCLSGV